MKSNLYIPAVQSLRAVAALMVVLMHLEGVLALYVGVFPRFFYWFCSSGVDLFFVISGFVMVHAHLADAGNLPRTVRFVRLRLIRIFPNYLFFALFAHFLLVTTEYHSDATVDLWASYFLLPQSRLTHLLPVAWTLNYELLFYGLFAFILCLPARYFSWGLGVWTAIIVAAQFGVDYDLHFSWQNFLLSAFQLQFLAGAWAAWWVRRPQVTARKVGPFVWLAAGLAMWGLTIVFSTYFIELSLLHRTERLWRGVLYAVSFGPVMVGVAQLSQAGHPNLFRGLLKPIGDASYTLYLMHFPLLYVWVLGFKILWPDAAGWEMAVGLFVPSYLVACVAYSLWHHRHIEKPLTLWLRKQTQSS